jgi:hypothetical protein
VVITCLSLCCISIGSEPVQQLLLMTGSISLPRATHGMTEIL